MLQLHFCCTDISIFISISLCPICGLLKFILPLLGTHQECMYAVDFHKSQSY